VKHLDNAKEGFDDALRALLRLPQDDLDAVEASVRAIIRAVQDKGDQAVLEYTAQFDRLSAGSIAELEVSRERQLAALASIDPLVREALETSVRRVTDYHVRQRAAFGDGEDWEFTDDLGNRLGQVVRAMQRVGLYAPGGKAAYPSTVMMTAIPAKVAGVAEVILVVPTPDGEINDTVLAAAALCEVDRVLTIGGAQAVAALAYGTESIPRVDKIVGPGSIYVAKAKEMVFGEVGIDMIAGPSEVVIVADATARADWLAMDMFAQAEHDEMAQAILISPDEALLTEVAQIIDEQMPHLPRREIVQQSLQERGALILVSDMSEASDIVNLIAPEHLELAMQSAEAFVGEIMHAGAIFIGDHSAEVVGDYTAGPSHVLPTNGTARFGSPLGVYDFQVRSSIVQCSPRGAVQLSRDAAIIAREEGLHAHAESAEKRVQG
jgi:histidinol dehydrogenase